MTTQNKTREPLFHLAKRTNVPTWQAWLVRAVTILVSFLLIGLLTFATLKIDPFTVYAKIFEGAFGNSYRVMTLMRDLAILLLFALAVTPAFKMKFWNIGAEGQVLMGAFACMFCIFHFGGKVNNVVLILISFAAALVVGAIWALIPALFKAKWNTNETLFTLMMNYVAIQIILYAIKVWVPGGTGTLPPSPYGNLPAIGGDHFWLSIIVAFVMTGLMFVYLKFTKHGYEITVVGESENTARYIGINVKKVIIRTLILSGLICGLTGFLLVAGIDHTVSGTTAEGRGFTAILVSWLAKFNPIFMIFTSLLVVFLSKGMDEVMTFGGVTNSFFSQVVIGITFLMIIGCEFFINYRVIFRHRASDSKAPALIPESPNEIEEKASAQEGSPTQTEEKKEDNV